MDNAIGWVEIPVENMARAKKFYQAVLGKEIGVMDMPGMEFSPFPYDMKAAGAGAALVKTPERKLGGNGIVAYFSCEDLTVELAKVEPNGGKIVLLRTPIADSGFMAHIRDTEGNLIGLHSWK